MKVQGSFLATAGRGLVVPKKGGSFVCDQDCPNWKALGICAHSVAVANLCSKLPEFVAWFKKAKVVLLKLLCQKEEGIKVLGVLGNENLPQ